MCVCVCVYIYKMYIQCKMYEKFLGKQQNFLSADCVTWFIFCQHLKPFFSYFELLLSVITWPI